MDLKSKRNYLVWLLSLFGSIGESVAPQSPGMSPLEPVFNIFESLAHDGHIGETIHHALADMVTWYLSLLSRVNVGSDQATQDSNLQSKSALEQMLSSRQQRQSSDGVLGEDDANFMGLSAKDLEDFDVAKLETHFQKLIDSFLPNPFTNPPPPTTVPTTTTSLRPYRKYHSARRNHGSHHIQAAHSNPTIQTQPASDV